MDALNSEDYVVRQEVCGALGSIGGSDTIRELEEVEKKDLIILSGIQRGLL